MLHPLWILPAAAILWILLRRRAFDRRVRGARADCRGSPDPRPAGVSRSLPTAAQTLVDRAGLRAVAERGCWALEQVGEMRTRPGATWMPFRGTQVVAVDRVEFVWHARIRSPLGLSVIDALGPDGGWFEARVLGALTVARAGGAAVTRGQVMRYLAEIAWCPRAVTANPALSFESTPSGALRARAHHAGVDAVVDLKLNGSGDVIGARGIRPRDTRLGPVETLWLGRFWDHAELGGVRIPTRGEVAWVLDGEEFVYWRARVTACQIG